MDVRFYCVATADYFPGLAALIDSLRLIGHREPVHVLDCGLTERQLGLLSGHAEVAATAGRGEPPYLRKWLLPGLQAPDVAVLVDTDVIVTATLDPLVAAATSGSIVAFVDRVVRFRPEWERAVDASLEPRPYVNSGVVAVPRAALPTLVEAFDRLGPIVDEGRTLWAGGSPEYPFYYADQDILNAVLMSGSAGDVEAFEHRLAPFPPFAGVRLHDPATLSCAYADGARPYLLHHVQAKPWLACTRPSVFTTLMTRLVLGSDVAVRLDAAELPLRLRGGVSGSLALRAAGAVAWGREQRGRLGLRRALRRHGWSRA